MKQKKRWLSVVLILLTILINSTALFGVEKEKEEIRILFTHDLHDAFTPRKEKQNSGVEEIGGYARLMTAINKEKETSKPTLLVDGGDYSMGTLFQSLYEVISPELGIMGKMGYDVMTFGNHDFDYRAEGLANSLNEAVNRWENLPQIVSSNISVPEDKINLQEALDAYGVKEYTVIEKDGIKIGVFGLMGKEAVQNAPVAGVDFLDQVSNAKRMVAALQKENVDLILCLSHSGTDSNVKNSEDENLAKEVPEIDVIVSAHTHTTLDTPIQIGNTWIGSSGSRGTNLGVMDLVRNAEGRWDLVDYRLEAIKSYLEEDPTIQTTIESYKSWVEGVYLKPLGLSFNQVVAHTTFDFSQKVTRGEDTLGNLISDAYRYAVKTAEGQDYEEIDVALVPGGTIRSSFITGDITVEDVFNVSPLGIGKDKTTGYPLIEVYLTGKELKTICEVDASLSPLSSTVQIYFSGLDYTSHSKRLPFNKVMDATLVREDGSREILQDDKLYRVVGGLYTAQSLALIEDKSFGILSVVPKTKTGEVITDFENHILYQTVGGVKSEIKEWAAIANYLGSFEKVNGISEIPQKYNEKEGRKIVLTDLSKAYFIQNLNWITLSVYGLVGFVILVILILIIFRQHRKKKEDNLLPLKTKKGIYKGVNLYLDDSFTLYRKK
jgi:2',3'-cyclic-nucleotide 2'-phosphodiesterase (5'-nucleotidase family)